MRRSRAARRNKRIKIQKPSVIQDEFGEHVPGWSDVVDVYSSVEPLRVKTKISGSNERSAITHVLSFLWRPSLLEIDDSWRVIYKERVFDIDSAINIDENSIEIELACTEGIREG